MNELGDLMKGYKFNSLFIMALFLISNLLTSVSNTEASIAPAPDQFVAEIFPNSTINLQLSHTNTILTFNATDFPNKIDINFDANYTIYNQENTTTLPIILPFSLSNTSDFIFEVQINDTQIPYNIFSVSPWNENITEIDVHLPGFVEIYPIKLVKSNVTFFRNSTSVVKYHFHGTMNNPLESHNLLYIIYSLGTSQEWLGNTSGRLEFKLYGKQPIISTTGYDLVILTPINVDINGGKSFSYEWNNIQIPWGSVGVKFYREASPLEKIIELIVQNLLIFIPIASVFIIAIILRRKRKGNVTT